MAHFAEINENNIVVRVLVVPDEEQHRGQDFLANELGLGGTWIKTSYNSIGGVHYLPDENRDEKNNRIPSGMPHLRFNYAGIGCLYDPIRDAFIPPKPTEEGKWILNEETCLWEEVSD